MHIMAVQGSYIILVIKNKTFKRPFLVWFSLKNKTFALKNKTNLTVFCVKNAQKYLNISVNFNSRQKCEKFLYCFYYVIYNAFRSITGGTILCVRSTKQSLYAQGSIFLCNIMRPTTHNMTTLYQIKVLYLTFTLFLRPQRSK